MKGPFLEMYGGEDAVRFRVFDGYPSVLMASQVVSCPSCGASVSVEKDRCDLCGTPVPDSEADAPSEADATPGQMAPEGRGAASEEASGGASDAGSVYCNDCGWENPAGANFCSNCGAKLQLTAASSAPSSGSASSGSASSGSASSGSVSSGSVSSGSVSSGAAEEAPEGTRPVAADLPGAPRTPGSSEAADANDAADDDADRRAEDAEQEAMGQQLTLVVGAAVLVVIGLFFVTLWSQSQSWGSEASGTSSGASGGPVAESAEGPRPGTRMQSSGTGAPVDLQQLARQATGPVPESVQSQVDSLEGVVQQRSGEAKTQARRALANLYIGAGQNALAALSQREVARATGEAADWEKAGQLFYAWMRRVEQQQGSPQEAQAVATATASAFERVLEAQPDNLMARTRMGEAYLLTNEPMQGIQAIRAVLETDSTFVPARFQLGLALLRINRLDRAVQEFEKVKAQAESGSQYAAQADRALRIISEQRSN